MRHERPYGIWLTLKNKANILGGTYNFTTKNTNETSLNTLHHYVAESRHVSAK